MHTGQIKAWIRNRAKTIRARAQYIRWMQEDVGEPEREGEGERERENGPADDPNLSRAGATAENSIKLLIYGRSASVRRARLCKRKFRKLHVLSLADSTARWDHPQTRCRCRLLKRLSRGKLLGAGASSWLNVQSSFSEFLSLGQYPSNIFKSIEDSRKRANRDLFRKEAKQKNVKAFLK